MYLSFPFASGCQAVKQKSGTDHSMPHVLQISPLLSNHKAMEASEDKASQLVRETFHKSESKSQNPRSFSGLHFQRQVGQCLCLSATLRCMYLPHCHLCHVPVAQPPQHILYTYLRSLLCPGTAGKITLATMCGCSPSTWQQGTDLIRIGVLSETQV